MNWEIGKEDLDSERGIRLFVRNFTGGYPAKYTNGVNIPPCLQQQLMNSGK